MCPEVAMTSNSIKSNLIKSPSLITADVLLIFWSGLYIFVDWNFNRSLTPELWSAWWCVMRIPERTIFLSQKKKNTGKN